MDPSLPRSSMKTNWGLETSSPEDQGRSGGNVIKLNDPVTHEGDAGNRHSGENRNPAKAGMTLSYIKCG